MKNAFINNNSIEIEFLEWNRIIIKNNEGENRKKRSLHNKSKEWVNLKLPREF